MNNLVKIILGVNIAVGGAGAFFAFSKSSKVGDLVTAKDTAETAKRTAENQQKTLKTGLDAAKKDLGKKDGEIAQLKTQLGALNGSAAQAKQAIDQANSLRNQAQTALAQAQSDVQSYKSEADKVPNLENQVAKYTFLGTPQDIRAKLEKLAQLMASNPKPKPKPKPKPVNFGEIASIVSYDPSTGTYVLNRGSDVGIKLGDKFSVFRNGQSVGKILMRRVQPTVSIATFDPTLGKPPTPFKSGDKVMKVE